MMREYRRRSACSGPLALLLAAVLGGQAVAETPAVTTSESTTERVITFDRSQWTGSPQKRVEPVNQSRLQREGLVVDYSARPLGVDRAVIRAEDPVELTLAIRDPQNQPIRGVYPAVWVDYNKTLEGDESAMECKDRVGMYLAGNVGIRPMVDLNSYYILVMNREPTISVIDPIIGVTGRTKLYAQVQLEQPGGDWVGSEDGKRLFVSMPQAGKVAVVDTEAFKVTATIEAGEQPLRVALQPDEQYLWIGNNAEGEAGGVTVIDTVTLKPVAQFATGAGHHEISFNGDGDKAYVSNRDSGTVSVFDTARLTLLSTLEAGGKPISLAYSKLAEMLYIVDAEQGRVLLVDQQQRITRTVSVAPGLGPLRISPDGRWGVLTQPFQDQVSIFDTATGEIVHQVAIEGKPYLVSFTRAFAYVRSLSSKKISMLELQHFGRDTLPVAGFDAGTKAPGAVSDPSIASQVVEAPGEAAVIAVSPADATVYYYMEGMNAPMGNFRNYGHAPRAVTVVDRTLREQQPGVYQARLKLPVAGSYQVAMVLESPQLLHCFELQVQAPSNGAPERDEVVVKYLDAERVTAAGQSMNLSFRLEGRLSGRPRDDLEQVNVMYYRAPGAQRQVVAAEHSGGGVYQVQLELARRGAYFVHVAVPEEQLGFDDLPHRTLVAR